MSDSPGAEVAADSFALQCDDCQLLSLSGGGGGQERNDNNKRQINDSQGLRTVRSHTHTQIPCTPFRVHSQEDKHHLICK